MLADRVRMRSSGGRNDLILYDNGEIYTEYGRTKNFSYNSAVGTITFNSDHFHIYTSDDDTFNIRAMVGFKIPPNLSTNAKIRIKYFDCDNFIVGLVPSVNDLNSTDSAPLGIMRVVGAFNGYSGTGEITLPLGDITGYEVVGVMTDTYFATHNNSFSKLEVII